MVRKKIKASAILNRIRKGDDVINYDKVEIVGPLDFTLLADKKALKQSVFVDSYLFFTDCLFSGAFSADAVGADNKVYFNKMIKIAKSTFTEQVSFTHAEFCGDVDFSGSVFKSTVNFISCDIHNPFVMEESLFSGKNTFVNLNFYNTVNFDKMESAGECLFEKIYVDEKEISFKNARFFSDVNFRTIRLKKDADFSFALFGGNAYFEDILFYGISVFENIRAGKSIKFIDIAAQGEDAVIKFCKITDISEKIFFIDSDMKNCSFAYSAIDIFEFMNTKWNIKKNSVTIYDEESLDNVTSDRLSDMISHIEMIYRQLKNNANKIKDYKMVDLFYSSELRIRMKKNRMLKDRIRIDPSEKNKAILCSDLKTSKSIPVWEKLYSLVSDFGMSWLKPWFWIVVIILISTLFSFMESVITGYFNSLTVASEEYYISSNRREAKLKNKQTDNSPVDNVRISISGKRPGYNLFVDSDGYTVVVFDVDNLIPCKVTVSYSYIPEDYRYSPVFNILRNDLEENEWIIRKSSFHSDPVYLLYSLQYHFCNSFFIQQKTVEVSSFFSIIFSRLENILVTSLLIMSGFAIRRKFRF